MESSVGGNKFLGEFNQLWLAVQKRQAMLISFGFILKDQLSLIISMNQELANAIKSSQNDQEDMTKMKQVC